MVLEVGDLIKVVPTGVRTEGTSKRRTGCSFLSRLLVRTHRCRPLADAGTLSPRQTISRRSDRPELHATIGCPTLITAIRLQHPHLAPLCVNPLSGEGS
jgi:hypothetical protein